MLKFLAGACAGAVVGLVLGIYDAERRSISTLWGPSHLVNKGRMAIVLQYNPDMLPKERARAQSGGAPDIAAGRWDEQILLTYQTEAECAAMRDVLLGAVERWSDPSAESPAK